MEAFQLLSRGGVKFDKRRFKSDLEIFNLKQGTMENDRKGKGKEGTLPAELDFFKYMQAGMPKRKAAESEVGEQSGDEKTGKKRIRWDSQSEDGESRVEGPSVPRHRVTSKGTNVPKPAESFEELQERYDLPTRLIQNLTEYGYNVPTAIQSHAVPILLEGRDLTAISPTGTGKTLAYLIPILAALKAPIASMKSESGGVRALVVAPTRELAHQIHNEVLKLAQGRKWKTVLFSKATASTLADKAVRDKVDIIVSTPLRLVDALHNGTLSLYNVRHIVLDEADRLFDTEFLSQTQVIVAACTNEDVQKAVFSATLPAGAEKIAMDMLRNPIRVVVGLKDTPLPSISQKLTYVADESSKLPTLLQFLSQPYTPPIIIFTSTQARATSLAEQLVLNSIPNVDCLHAGMTKKEREDAITRMRKGESWVMISTEVMARGMDFKGVRGVINYDFPTSVQSYVHRIGRTGRAGKEGMAITYFTNEDAPFLKPIANVLLQSGSTVPEWMLKLPKPSKIKRREMGKVKRGDQVTKDGRIGKSLAMKKKQMVEASKRRKAKAASRESDGEDEARGAGRSSTDEDSS